MTENLTADAPGAADFTPNPDRAIWIEGRIDQALLDRLLPEISELTAQSREPITVFIDSHGGKTHVAENILLALRQTTPDDPRVSRIITVAAPRAWSAAANLLSAGDFAIAHRDSDLLYHGGRILMSHNKLTAEVAREGRTMHTLDEISAAGIAFASLNRFLFIISALRPSFAQHRADAGDPTLADVDCFHALLRGRLSPAGQKVVDLAVPLSRDYDGLFRHFRKKLRRGRAVTKTRLQQLMLYASANFEYEAPARDNEEWYGRMGRISEGFYFLNAYFNLEGLREWCAASPSTSETVRVSAEEEYLVPFRILFRALCRALNEGENYLTPMDAVWLGLIDTVSGDPAPSRATSEWSRP